MASRLYKYFFQPTIPLINIYGEINYKTYFFNTLDKNCQYNRALKIITKY